MPRVRLAVALLVPEPAATEIDGLRRALGDRGLSKVVPHITLVPPVNVPADGLAAALRVVREVAATTRPFTVKLGPPTTFAPVTPVVYLGVADGAEAVHELRNRLRVAPLDRPTEHDFVPHVTIDEDREDDRIPPAIDALRDYEVDVRFDGVDVLQDKVAGPRRWNSIAESRFAPPLVVGRGGMPLSITVSRRDVEASALLGDAPTPPGTVVVVARRDGDVVAAARAIVAEGELVLREVSGDPDASRHLLRAVTATTGDRS